MKKGVAFKISIVSAIVILLVLFFAFDLDSYLRFSVLKSKLDIFKAFYAEHRLVTIVLYLAGYVAITALSLPGALIISLAGGAVFGLVAGTVIVSFASTIGATLAFMVSRYVFRDWVQEKFASQLSAINQGVEKEGGFYLFALRLVPVFPFFMINLAMGLTRIRATVFYLVSQAGMLPGTIVFINAGTQLGKLESASGILSPGILFSFALLGIFPIVAKKMTTYIRTQKVYAPYKKPDSFDYNIAAIGAGAAGLVTCYIAAAVKAKAVLIEENKMGGDCLNTGCVPSKSLIASAKLAALVKRAREFGFKTASADIDFKEVMDRVHNIIKRIEPNDSTERYTAMGVDCIQGRAKIISPFEVEVDGRRITARNIVVATGARPMIPELPGLETIRYYTSDTIWGIKTLPKRLVVLGAGPIGCELSQAFSRLGSQVTIVQRGPQVMKKEDPDAAAAVTERFLSEGIQVLTGHSATAVECNGDKKVLVCDNGGETVDIEFDEILIALGRTPNINGFGLEDIGVSLSNENQLETNEFLQTNFPNIYCCGDVLGRYQFTHTASHEAWYASVNALFGRFKKFKTDYRTIPWATYTDPEVARVGLNETEAKKEGVDYEMVTYHINDLDRAITDSEDYGFVKVLTRPGKDKILGVTIVGNHASDIISEFVLAMKHGIGLNKILGTIHIYPSMAEANKYAAGVWKKAHAPEGLLRWVEKYHTWMRRS